MKALHRFSIRHPALVIAIAVAALAGVAPGIARLELRTDGQALVPQDAPEVRGDAEVRRAFGLRDPIVVMVAPRDGTIYRAETLRLLHDLSAAFARLPGMDAAHVQSLATEPSDRFRPGSLERRRLLEPLPRTPDELERVRADVAAVDWYRGTLLSADARAAALLLGTPPGADRAALVGAIHAAIARADTAGHAVDVIGAPVAEALLGVHVLEDLGLRLGPAPSRELEDLGLPSRVRALVARHVGLLPLAIVTMALVFLIAFRSLTATWLPLGEAAACLIFVFGLMGWCGIPVYLTMAVLPVILVSMGLADEIHVFASWSRRRAERPDAPAAAVAREALDEMHLPVVATSLTTAIGFLSFAASPLPPVRWFGVFTAAGIAFCMLWTLTVIPALLVLTAPRGFLPPRTAPAAPRDGAWMRLGMGLARRPLVPLLVVALVGLAACFGARRLVVQDGWISGFAPDSRFHRATTAFNRGFYGTHRLLLALDAGRLEWRGALPGKALDFESIRLPREAALEPARLVACSLIVARRDTATAPGGFWRPAVWSSIVREARPTPAGIVVTTPPEHGSAQFLLMPTPEESLDVTIRSYRMADPAVLREIAALETLVRGRTADAVGGVLGPPDLIATAEFLTSDRDPVFRDIPSDVERVAWLWDAIERVQGRAQTRAFVDSTLQRGVVAVFLRDANFVGTGRLMDTLRAYERERLAPHRLRLAFAGDVAVSQTLVRAIVDSQVRSLGLSLAGILLVTAVLFRSPVAGLLCVLPAGLAILVTFGAMGATGMPLGVATSMFAAMVLGVGVDFAIHLVARYRAARRSGLDADAGLRDALAATTPPIVVNALAVGLGFGLLVLSRVPANARLGAVTLVSLLACLAATLLWTPSLLRLWNAGTRRKVASTPDA